MPIGPGKYDEPCTIARESTQAVGVALLVFGGIHGDGFSVQAPYEVTRQLPAFLEQMAKDIRASLGMEHN